MSQEELKALLQRLHEELSSTETVDEEIHALLGVVVRDIQGVLGEKPNDDTPHGLVERLKEATEEFEEDHPDLTAAVSQVVNALSRIGI